MTTLNALGTHNRNDPRGDGPNKGNNGRLGRRVVRFHYSFERAVEVVLSGLQSVKAVSKPCIGGKKQT